MNETASRLINRKNKKKLLFLIDDSRTFRATLSIILKKEGFEVDTFEDGFTALKKLENCIPDGIISDIEMPQMDGVQFFKEVQKRNTKLRSVPFLFISSTMSISKIEEVERLNNKNMIKKSSPVKEIICTIKSQIELN